MNRTPKKVWCPQSGYPKQPVAKWVQERTEVLERWFRKLQDGTHVLALADPWQQYDDGAIDAWVEEIDRRYEEYEGYRVKGISPQFEGLPEFHRLSRGARRMMWTEYQNVLNYQEEHQDDYWEADDEEDLWDKAGIHPHA